MNSKLSILALAVALVCTKTSKAVSVQTNRQLLGGDPVCTGLTDAPCLPHCQDPNEGDFPGFSGKCLWNSGVCDGCFECVELDDTTSADCSARWAPFNGEVSCTGAGAEGDVVTYTCIDGFTLSGESSSECEASGHWSNPTPVCQGFCRTDCPFGFDFPAACYWGDGPCNTCDECCDDDLGVGQDCVDDDDCFCTGLVCDVPDDADGRRTCRTADDACEGDELECDGECVDPSTDPDHCGACGVECETGEECKDGQCCTDCTGECVDLNTDTDNCGACGNTCGGDETCQGGDCVASDYYLGENNCDDGRVVTDVTECGVASTELDLDYASELNRNDEDAVCFVCEGLSCVPSTNDDDRVQVNDDWTLGGDVQFVCAPGCPLGEADCGGTCVDVDATEGDVDNCGGCGVECPADRDCSAGVCVCNGAVQALDCFGECVDAEEDADNCGVCGKKCLDGSCDSGECCEGTDKECCTGEDGFEFCTCVGASEDCDDDGEDGECPALSDPSNGSVSNDSDGADEGDTRTYECNDGYSVVGYTETTCQSDGTWSRAAPVCGLCQPWCQNPHYDWEEKCVEWNDQDNPTGDCLACKQCVPTVGAAGDECENLWAPNNGEVSSTTGSDGDTVDYDCQEGFTLVGDSSTTCQADGTWTNPTPQCVGGCPGWCDEEPDTKCYWGSGLCEACDECPKCGNDECDGGDDGEGCPECVGGCGCPEDCDEC